ncbi:MAG: helix-turn-helix domain-containing protein [Burkholderiaceae bacterium]
MARQEPTSRRKRRTNGDGSADTATRLLLATERVIAQDGVANVSMRRINAEAGTSNISALHYYFGSLEQAIKAVFDLRSAQAEARRQEVLAELQARGGPLSVQDVLHAAIWPLAEMMLGDSTEHHYIGFVAAINRSPQFDMWNVIRHRNRRGLVRCYILLRRALPGIPKDILHTRMMLSWREALYALADVDEMIQARHPDRREPLVIFHATDLITRISAALAAPVSEATLVVRRVLMSRSTSDKGTLFGMDSFWKFGPSSPRTEGRKSA